MLFVDDDIDLTQIVSRAAALASKHLTLDVAHTATCAKRLLSQTQYDFVLLDQFLDDEARGSDLIRLVQKTQSAAEITLTSAMDPAELAVLGEKNRWVHTFPKPFSAIRLRTLLHDALHLDGVYPSHVASLE